jgi:hypothetical protein
MHIFEKKLFRALLTILIILTVFGSIYASIRPHSKAMNELYENSNLPPIEIGERASREFSEQDGGNYRDTNFIEVGEMVWAIVTYHHSSSSGSYNSISGAVWYGDPYETSFNEEFHVFGIRAGRQWSDNTISLFTEKGFDMWSAVFENDEYFIFEQPNKSYYLRFRVNPDNYLIEIMVSLRPLG